METDNNNNEDSDSDDPTLELEPLSEATCKMMMQADDAPAEPDALAEAENSHQAYFEKSEPVSDDTTSEIRGLREELNYIVDLNKMLRHENNELRERCDRLAEQVSSLVNTSETFSNELERSQQQVLRAEQQLAEARATEQALLRNLEGLDKEAPHSSEKRRSSGVRLTPPARSPGAGLAPGSEVQSCLVLLDANDAESDTWVLDDGINTIGSSHDCDIKIPSQFVSRHHAQLIKAPTGSVLEDLNSTNGTYVNARRINKRSLRAGDLVTIGKHRLRYRERSDHLVMSDLSKFGSGLQSGKT